MVVDTGDVVSHLLTGAARSYYDLDGLWADAEEVDPLVTSGKGEA
jgi:ribosomal silencing factor RsfS